MCNPSFLNMSSDSLSTLSWSPSCSSPDNPRVLSTTEWLSTLQFLEGDDCFFGEHRHCPEDSHDRLSAAAHFHASTGSSMDVSLTPLPLDSIGDSARRSSLTSINNNDLHQQLPNSNVLSKIDQTIDIRNMDYHRRGSTSVSLPQAPVSAPAPGRMISSTAVLQAHQELLQASSPKTEEQPPPKKKRKPRATSFEFPFRVHEMLQGIQGNAAFEAAIQWLPEGNGFKVTNIQVFSNQVLPAFFGTLKYKSFLRQLNIYGFERRHGAYIHPYFVRGHPNLCWNMRRQKVKGTGIKPLREEDLVKKASR